MYNGGGGGTGGSSRPPTSQVPEMRYTSNSSPRPPVGAAARPYTAGSHYDAPAPPPVSAGQYHRPSTQGSTMTAQSNVPGFDYHEQGRRPSMPTPVHDRPNYSRNPSPAPYAGYHDDEYHRAGYGAEETFPLTAYPTHPGTPGTPYEGFEGDTGNSV